MNYTVLHLAILREVRRIVERNAKGGDILFVLFFSTHGLDSGTRLPAACPAPNLGDDQS